MRGIPTVRRLLSRLRERHRGRRDAQAERALRRNEARAQRLRHERFDEKTWPAGPSGR
jgi:hypothetical protein